MSRTEDDTFRILARPSLSELLDLFKNLPDMKRREILVNYTTRSDWLQIHGWTIEEYRDHCNRLNLHDRG